MNIAKIESLAKSIVPTLKAFVEQKGQAIEDGIRKDFEEKFGQVHKDISDLAEAQSEIVSEKRVEVISRKVFDEELEEYEFEVPVEDIDRAEKFVSDYFESLRECLSD